jgi:hypothetical protein
LVVIKARRHSKIAKMTYFSTISIGYLEVNMTRTGAAVVKAMQGTHIDRVCSRSGDYLWLDK